MIDQLIVTLVGLGLLGGGYLLWLLTGIVNAAINTKTWSWKKTISDISKALVMAVVILGLVALSNGMDWYAGLLGFNISEFTDGLSIVTMLGGIVAGIATYYGRAMKNALNFFKLKDDVKPVGEQNYNQIANDVRDFLETITGKTSKEDVESATEIEAHPEVLDYVELTEEEAGKGGVNNTYPEPYRSAVQDSITDPSTCYNRECVSYTAWKIKELTGSWPKRTGGMNARYWVQRLAENGYVKVVDRPVNGGKYVGVTEAGQYGHVVWFEEGETISEYNYSIRGGFSVRVVNPAAYKWVEIKAPATPVVEPAKEEKPKKKDEVVSYTYKAGDTFGQVIRNLGLATSHGLWDPVDGDVAYYNKQLAEQGITGNIPIGTTIKLTKRK